MIVMLVSCVICLFVCESMLKTLRTMFGFSVRVNKVFLMNFVRFYHLSLLKLLLTIFKCFVGFWSVLMCLERKIRKFEEKIEKVLKNPKKSCF